MDRSTAHTRRGPINRQVARLLLSTYDVKIYFERAPELARVRSDLRVLATEVESEADGNQDKELQGALREMWVYLDHLGREYQRNYGKLALQHCATTPDCASWSPRYATKARNRAANRSKAERCCKKRVSFPILTISAIQKPGRSLRRPGTARCSIRGTRKPGNSWKPRQDVKEPTKSFPPLSDNSADWRARERASGNAMLNWPDTVVS